MARPDESEGRPSVLVVDDEPASLDAFRRIFRDELAMRLCGEPHDALEALAAESFDVVIVDHAMPGMTGVELLEAVRDRAPDSGRIIVTGYPDAPEVREADSSGLTATVIAKPWKHDEVVRWAHHFERVRTLRRAVAGLRGAPRDDEE